MSEKNVFDIRKASQIVIPRYNTSYLTVLALNELNAVIAKANKKEEPVAQKNGLTIGIVKDNQEEQTCEILIGQTSRTTIEKTMHTDEYVIVPAGDKLMIDGGSARVVNYAIFLLKSMLEAGNYQVDEVIKGTYTEEVDVAGYSNTVTEEFDGNELSDLWTVWDRNAHPERYMKQDNTLKFLNYRDENNVWVEGGCLNLKAYMDEFYTDEDGIKTQIVRTAKMDTREHFWFQYGYVEFSTKSISGPGLACTVWLHGDSSKIGNLYNEFDLPEFYGNNKYYRAVPFAWKVIERDGGRKNVCTYYFGGQKISDVNRYQLENGEEFCEAFHTYGLEWDEDYFKFIVDGEILHAYKYTDVTVEDLALTASGSRYFTPEEVITAYHQPSYAVVSIKAGAYNWENPVHYPKGEEIVASPERIFKAKFDGEDNVMKLEHFMVYQKKGQLSGETAQAVRNLMAAK